jgi:hypothetical protein
MPEEQEIAYTTRTDAQRALVLIVQKNITETQKKLTQHTSKRY